MRRRLLSLLPVAALRSTRLPLVGCERASTTFGRPCGRGCQCPKLRLLLGGYLTGDWSSSVATKANRSCDSASVSFRHSGHVLENGGKRERATNSSSRPYLECLFSTAEQQQPSHTRVLYRNHPSIIRVEKEVVYMAPKRPILIRDI